MDYSIFLRPFYEDDYILINKWRNDPNIQKYTVGPLRFVSLSIEKEWVKSKMMNNQQEIYWSICLNNSEQNMIGYISVNDIDHLNKKAHWGGIVIGDKKWQIGKPAIEAVILMLQYVFEELNINRLSGTCLIEHPSSGLLMKALGFKQEGILREFCFKHGVYKDVETYSLLRYEYIKEKEEGLTVRKIMNNIINIKNNIKNYGK